MMSCTTAILTIVLALLTAALSAADYTQQPGGWWRPIDSMVSHHNDECVTTLRIDRLDPGASVSQWFLSVPSGTRWVQIDSPVPFAVWHAQFTYLEHRFNFMIQTETPAGIRWKSGAIQIQTADPLTIFDAACVIAGEGGQAMLGPIESFFWAPTPEGPWQWHSVATVAPDCTRVVYDPLDGPVRFFRHALPAASMRISPMTR